MPILAGVGALRTDEAVSLAQDARAAGAVAGLLAPVSYTPLTDDEVFEHFATVARESRLPLCIYDNPGTTHFRFSPALVGRLSRLPGIVALKSPPRSRRTWPRISPNSAAPCRTGSRSAIAATGTRSRRSSPAATLGTASSRVCFPKLGMTLVRAVRSGDAAEARRVNERLRPLWALFKEFSSLRVIYASVDLLGICRVAPPRPILPLSELPGCGWPKR